MTVCIATISENKYIIFVTDRMMTLTLYPYQFTHGGSKLRELDKNTIIAFAGLPMLMDCLITGSKKLLSKKNSSETPIEIIKKAFDKERIKRIEENILRKHDFNLEKYRKYYKENKIWETQLTKISAEMEAFELKLWLLVGINTESNISIHQVNSPGTSEDVSAIGYHAIGAGAPYAMQVFMDHDYQTNFSLSKSLFIAFEAKKNGEKATGVGEKTDIWILEKDKIIKLREEQVKKIGKLLEERNLDIKKLNEKIFNKVREEHLL